MKKTYSLIALFGFFASLIVIFGPMLLAGDGTFAAPSGFGLAFFLRYYLFALTFFVVFVLAAALRERATHRNQPLKWFAFALLSFTVGSFVAGLGTILLVMWSLSHTSFPL